MVTVGWNTTGDAGKNYRHRVALKRPNELGLYDMSGNVSEMCKDWYDENYYSNSPSANPKGPYTKGNYLSGHVIRGGDFKSKDADCRVACRHSQYEADYVDDVGFRVVLSQ